MDTDVRIMHSMVSVHVHACMCVRVLAGVFPVSWCGTAGPYFLAITERSSSIYGYGWIFQASIAAQLLFAAQLAAKDATEAALWRDMAGMQLNYIMGTNPQGFSLITGLGARRITNPVDDESVYDEWVSAF